VGSLGGGGGPGEQELKRKELYETGKDIRGPQRRKRVVTPLVLGSAGPERKGWKKLIGDLERL